jgi:hypothetical protein
MTAWKMPSEAKVYEALSAYADGRVHIKSPTEAEVKSSAGDKTYLIQWSEDMRRISSNDNASYWQGYIGYPIIAVLLALGKIDFDGETAKLLAGVPWKRINEHFKRDYEKAVDSVLQEVETKGGNKATIVQQVENIYLQLVALKLERGPQGTRPPKSGKTR